MKLTKIKFFYALIVILLLSVILTIASKSASQEAAGKYDAFATCLKDKGAVFYGAFWCPHCQAEKKLFGSSEKLLPYVECSTSIGGQTQFCKDKKITAYPTWELADGTRLLVENSDGVSLKTLAQKTSCVLPE